MLGSAAIKFLCSLLVITLWCVTVTVIMGQTVLNSRYLENQLDTTNSYSRLSTALAQEIAQSPDVSAIPNAETTLQSILTPAVVKAKVNGAIEQIEAYNKGSGPRPVIDLSDLAAQAQAAGIPVGQNSALSKPIAVGGDQSTDTTKSAGQVFGSVQLGTLIATAVLLAGLGVLSWQQRRYTALPTVLIVVGAGLGVLAVVLYCSVGVSDYFIKLGSTSNALVSWEHDLAKSLTRDLGKRFGIVAAGYLLLGIVGRIVAVRLQPKPAAASKK